MIKRRALLKTMCVLVAGASAALLAMNAASFAHEYEVGKIKVHHPWVRVTKGAEP